MFQHDQLCHILLQHDVHYMIVDVYGNMFVLDNMMDFEHSVSTVSEFSMFLSRRPFFDDVNILLTTNDVHRSLV